MSAKTSIETIETLIANVDPKLRQWLFSGFNLVLLLISSYYLQGAFDARQALNLMKAGLLGIRKGQ